MKLQWEGKVYLHRDVVDFRKSLNGLLVIIEQSMELDTLSPSLFIFCCRRRKKLKIVYWDTNGYCLWYKRLEQSKFYWPKHSDEEVITLPTEQLEWLLNGLNVDKLKPHSFTKNH